MRPIGASKDDVIWMHAMTIFVVLYIVALAVVVAVL